MSVTISLRANQTTPLSYNQMDGNFTALANAIAVLQQQIAQVQFQGGATASRPTLTSTPVITLYQPYFDTTLGQPVFCSQISPTIIWVNSAGVQV